VPPSGIGSELLPIHAAIRNVPVRPQSIRVDLDYRVLWLDSHSTCELRKHHRIQDPFLARMWTPISLVIASYPARPAALQRIVAHARVGQLLLEGFGWPETLHPPLFCEAELIRHSPDSRQFSGQECLDRDSHPRHSRAVESSRKVMCHGTVSSERRWQAEDYRAGCCVITGVSKTPPSSCRRSPRLIQ